MTRAFVIKHGAWLDPNIWQQNRMTDAQITFGLTVLSPTIITKMYFRYLFPPTSSVLSGEKGIGKSFSFLIYDHFSSLVNVYKINNEKFRSVQNEFIPL